MTQEWSLRDCYRKMLRIRLVEEAIAARYSEQQMRCPVHLSIGQEAVAVGVCSQLKGTDLVYSNHRSHSHYLAKGGDLKAFIAELYGRETGCAQGRGGSMHLIDLEVGFAGSVPIVASSIPIAVGAAWAKQFQADQSCSQDRSLVTTFFGEAATEEGVFHESLNYAKLENLPVLFVCENNLYSVYSPPEVRRDPNIKITELANAHQLPTWQADGNNVEAVSEVTAAAVNHIRNEQGPAFVQLDTYRWREHCGPNYDNDIGYRTENEFLKWQARCPLKIGEQLLGSRLSKTEITAWTTEIKTEIEAAFQFALSSPEPSPETRAAHLFAAEGKG